MNVADMTVEHLFEAQLEYEKRFGPCPVGIMDGGGPEGLFALVKKALLNNQPLPESFHSDLPADAIIA